MSQIKTNRTTARICFGLTVAVSVAIIWEADSREKIMVLLAGGFLALASAWDINQRRIPNRLNLAFALVMLGAGFGLSSADFPRAAAAGAAVFLVFLALHLIHPRGLGMGDVKLAFGLGTFLGWFSIEAVYLGIVAAFILNGLASLIVLLGSAERSLPFAPALGWGSMSGLIFSLAY